MSFSGIYDVDQKIFEYIHLDDLIDVLLIHPKIRKLIIDNIGTYLDILCDNYSSRIDKQYIFIPNFIVKLFKIDEIELAKKSVTFN